MKRLVTLTAVAVLTVALFGTHTSSAAELSGTLDLVDIAGRFGGVRFNGIDNSDQSGFLVSSAGDINGDRIDDLLIGAVTADPNGNTDAGETYLVYGQSGAGAGS